MVGGVEEDVGGGSVEVVVAATALPTFSTTVVPLATEVPATGLEEITLPADGSPAGTFW